MTKREHVTRKENALDVKCENKKPRELTKKKNKNVSVKNYWLSNNRFPRRFSKHPFIADSSVVTALPDGSPSSMNFADNRNNRFK